MDPANSRKFAAFYFSFLEYGRWRLMETWAWLPCGLFKSAALQGTPGGLGWAFTQVCLEFFGRGRSALSTEGVVLHFGHPRIARVFFKYEGMVADEDALRQCWAFKGASGNKVCPKCRNCLRKASGHAHNDAYFVDHSDPNLASFDPETTRVLSALPTFSQRRRSGQEKQSSKSWRRRSA